MHALIVSGENKITSELIKQLKEKLLEVVILKDQSQVGEYITSKQLPSYIFLIEVDFNYDAILDLAKNQGIKTEIVFPYTDDINNHDDHGNNIYVIYAGILDQEKLVDELLRGIFSYGFSQKVNYFGEKIDKVEPLLEPELTPLFAFQPQNVTVDVPKEVVKEVLPQQAKTKHRRKIEIKISKPKLRFKAKRLIIIIFLLIWIFNLPFLFLFASSFSLKIGSYEIAKVAAGISDKTFIYFTEGKQVSKIIKLYAESYMLYNELTETFKKVGKEKIDTSKLYLNADDLYTKLSYIGAQEKNLGTTKNFLPNIDLTSAISYLANGKEIIKKADSLLGNGGKASYLILFQDNKELWPSGGKIRRFAVVNFEEGKIVSTNYFENEDINKNIKGEIEAPLPLQRYLGVKNLIFEYSNWDADFRASAQKAVWFLEKSMNTKVNGVIAINQDSFEKIKNSTSFLEEVLAGLNAKEILVYFQDQELYQPLSNFNWDGGVSEPKCDGNCYVIYSGLVDANLGGKKQDDKVIRTVNLDVDFTQRNILTKMQVNLHNGSNEIYKDYLRVPNSENYQFLNIEAGKTAIANFNWQVANSLNFTKPGKIIIYIRKQPGSTQSNFNINVKMPSNLTVRGATSYNTNLTTDFVKEIQF